ncbi:universal stress protein [Fulvivirga sp. RKSG066]|uniref:universal stress protein n=1 Tax=Fulvivirga aurantia TaxID=2529383 RepID=UPI0012BCA795|nr:universal stress protein [Fulvivirga aurantia]MTI19968.1 universal stress protein [Fulvivirga aurantia]
MEPFKEILVGLDTSELDKTLIRYASFVADNSSAERITFVNMVRNLTIPTQVRKEFPHLAENALKERKELISQSIEEHFNPKKKVKTKVVVKKGQAPMLLEEARKSNIDLIIIGQKKTLDGTGVTTLRLARRADCNLLIIPENVEPKADKILVPIDFSNHAKLAVEQTIDFVKKTGLDTEVVCQNVYAVPAGYHYTGKTYQEFAEIMKKNSQEAFQKFMKKIDTRGVSITEEYSLDTNDNLASDIYDFADKINPDFIVIGAKGRTAAAALFLGSLAEKMVNEKMNHPLLVVRFKGRNAGLLETLREF